jgi:hypothetical protein
MEEQKKSGHCKKCDKDVKVLKKGANHMFHLIITIALGVATAPLYGVGAIVWGVIWIVASLKTGSWHCDECGAKKVANVS